MKSVPRYTCFMTELSRRSSRWDRPNVLPNSYQSNQAVLEYFLTYFIRFISDQNQTFIHTWPSLSHRTLPKKKKTVNRTLQDVCYLKAAYTPALASFILWLLSTLIISWTFVQTKSLLLPRDLSTIAFWPFHTPSHPLRPFSTTTTNKKQKKPFFDDQHGQSPKVRDHCISLTSPITYWFKADIG